MQYPSSKWLVATLAVLGACAAPAERSGNGRDAAGTRDAERVIGHGAATSAEGEGAAEGAMPGSGAAGGDALPAAVDPGLETPDAGSAAPAQGCDALEMDPSTHDAVFQIGTRLEAGEEAEICALYQTPSRDIWMNSSDHALTAGAHHAVLWLTTLAELPEVDALGEPVELGKVVGCAGNVNRFDAAPQPISGSQGAGNLFSPRGAMPANVAIRIPASSYVVMDLHVLNTGDEPIEPCLKIGLNGVPQSQVEHEAGAFLLSNSFISAPAGERSVARMACPVTSDIELKTAVSHMHELGVGYEARWLDGDPYAPVTTLRRVLYETTEWADPVDTVFDTPLRLAQGDFIDFECRYQNATERDVAKGTEAQDEMCLFIGIFWPYDQTMAHCGRRPGDADGAAYQIGDGAMDGSAFVACYWQNVGREGAVGFGSGFSDFTPAQYAALYDFQSCFVDACGAIGRFTRPYVNCVADHTPDCQSVCADEIEELSATCTTTSSELGGCAEAFGTDGSDGTCALSSATLAEATARCGEQDPECLSRELASIAATCTTACLSGCVRHGLDACVVDCLHQGPCQSVTDDLLAQPCE